MWKYFVSYIYVTLRMKAKIPSRKKSSFKIRKSVEYYSLFCVDWNEIDETGELSNIIEWLDFLIGLGGTTNKINFLMLHPMSRQVEIRFSWEYCEYICREGVYTLRGYLILASFHWRPSECSQKFQYVRWTKEKSTHSISVFIVHINILNDEIKFKFKNSIA